MNAPAKKKSAAKKIAPPATSTANTLNLRREPGKSDERIMAECALSAVMTNSATARMFSQGTFGASDLNATVAAMREKAEKVQRGDLSEIEATLAAQAVSLDLIFTELARRAALNMCEHLHATEIYLRHAFKAQAQCRSTLETLAEIKNPRPVAFVKQANISHGHQQVNNGVQVPLAHGNEPIQSNELTGAGNELLEDTRASQVQSRVNPAMETVGAINRAKD
jgi:hypothetical protein